MGVRTVLIIGAIATATATFTAAPAAADEAAFLGTYVQNAPCKGDGKDDAKKLVKIGDKQVDSNFGPCVFADKQVDGKSIKANATCKAKGGSDFEVKLSFTMKDDNTIDFLEEGSQYKSVLYRCPAGK
jgi:type 1 fimbria pilin